MTVIIPRHLHDDILRVVKDDNRKEQLMAKKKATKKASKKVTKKGC